MKKLNFLIAFILLGTFIILGSMLAKGQSNAAGTPINISRLIGYEKADRVYIEWAADAGTGSYLWEVQSSINGKKFSTIALVLGPDPGKEGEQYTFKGKIKKANMYYRVVYFNQAGLQQQSAIIKLAKQDPLSIQPQDSRTLPAEL